MSTQLSLCALIGPLVAAMFAGSPGAARSPASPVINGPQHPDLAMGGAPLTQTRVRVIDIPAPPPVIVEARARRRARNAEPEPQKAPAEQPATAPSNAANQPAQDAPQKQPAAAGPAQPQSATPSAEVTPPVPVTWTDTEIVEALKACVQTLAPLNAEVDVTPAIRADRCGTPAPVILKRLGISRVALQHPATMNCAMVAALNRWIEQTLQPAAQDLYGSPVVRLEGTSAYVCRNRNHEPNGPISEHAFGNAIDIGGFVLADGRKVSVLENWGTKGQHTKTAAAEPEPVVPPIAKAKARGDKTVQKLGGPAAVTEPVVVKAQPKAAPQPQATTEAVFLRRVHDGACSVFGTVLGPEANEAHRNHFHFDLKARRSKGICQ